MGSLDFRPASQRRVGAYTTPPAMTIGGAARVPSAQRPTLVVASIDFTCTDAQNRTVNLQVETAVGSGSYDTIAEMRRNPDVSGLGVGITDISTIPATVIVPPGFGYRFTTSGTGTAAIGQIRETLL